MSQRQHESINDSDRGNTKEAPTKSIPCVTTTECIAWYPRKSCVGVKGISAHKRCVETPRQCKTFKPVSSC